MELASRRTLETLSPSPANALEVYARLRDATRIDVELERGGSSIRKSYSIR